MKRITISVYKFYFTILLISSIIVLSSCGQFNREASTNAIKNLPYFEYQNVDSPAATNSSKLPTGRPILLIYFKTDCPHCQQETRMIHDRLSFFKNSDIYFLSYMPADSIKMYRSKFMTNGGSNVTFARDINYSFAKLFRPTTIPLVAVYSSDKRLVKLFTGETEIEKIEEAAIKTN